jgi:hypothetical protein
MDMPQAFGAVCEIANAAGDARSGWVDLIGLLSTDCGAEVKEALAAVDIDADVGSVRQQVSRLMKEEPPSVHIDALWFGLFDTCEADDVDGIGYYVAGIAGFDAEAPDSRCCPVWWPEGRYLTSEALSMVKRLEVLAGQRPDRHAQQFLAYAGQLGAALLVSRFATQASGNTSNPASQEHFKSSQSRSQTTVV